MIFRPLYVDRIVAYAGTPFVKVITGVRRCGKSTILKMIMEKLRTERNVPADHMVSCRYDSMEYDGMTAKQMYDQLKERLCPGGKTWLFLDEVQEISGWEKVVSSLASDFDVDLYVTGSHARMMSPEFSTCLTGRYILFPVFTLSFSESLRFREEYDTAGDPKSELAEYLRTGGFPAARLQKYSRDEVDTMVRDIFHSTMFTEIVRRNQIRKIDRLDRVVRYVVQNVGHTFSAKSVSDCLSSEHRALDHETVSSCLEMLEQAYLIHRCPRYDVRGKKILKTQEKFYLADTALRYSLLGDCADRVAAGLENIVYLELRRRGYTVYAGKLGAEEIGFVAARQNEKIYVQVAREAGSEQTEEREYRRLLEIRDNYPKYVLRTDEFAGGNEEGIKIMHAADFLLSTEY